MSKSSKSARHSDDKNYQRKVMNAPQKIILEENLKQLHDPRSNISAGTNKQSNTAQGRRFKSKLRSPVQTKVLHTSSLATQVNSHLTSSKTVDKRLTITSFHNSKQYNTMKVHQDSSEPIILHQTKASRKEIKQPKAMKVEDNNEKDKEIKLENTEPVAVSNINGKSAVAEFIQHESQQSSSVDSAEEVKNECAVIEALDNNETNNKTDEIESDQNNLNGHKETKPLEEKSDEITVTLETSETIALTECEKVEEEEHEENKKEKKEEDLLVLPVIEEDVQSRECQSGSDLVGSTTSESSPVKDVENYLNKKDSNTPAKEIEDVSLISYDSNIMLKDVQIKLNDCLKDNSKLLDVTDPNASMSETFKDLSFGRTLRGISGRNSLRRMKHVTVRERLLTPNDSLFVNTSGVSMLHDQSRYSDLNSPYQSSSYRDRKRKLDDDNDGNESMKKLKTDESYGLLNTSLEYLRNLRKPIQVSTPNAHGYKFNIDDKKTNDNEHAIAMEQMDEPKKWCVVM